MIDDPAIESLRRDRGALEAELRNAGASIRGNTVKCIFHDDKTPSAGFYLGEDGAWRFKCQGCGVCEDIIGVRALIAKTKPGDVLKDMRAATSVPHQKPAKLYPTLDALKASVRNLEACYVYAHPATKSPQMVVVRSRDDDGKKTFIQASPSGTGFTKTAPPKPWPIYNRSRLIGASTVVVCEGEKCCHALHDAGHVATTSPGGAGKASLADWTPLAGKTVYLWPDNDPVDDKGVCKGDAHMRDVHRELEKLSPAPTVLWVDPSMLELPPKGDVVEFLEMFPGDTKEARRETIACALQMAKPLGGATDLRKRLDDAKAGKLSSVAWPYRLMTKLSKALLPGTVTAVCADPGSGKSFFSLEVFAAWHQNKVKSAVYMLEDGKDYHLNRVFAQLAEKGDLADTDWVNANPEETDALYAQYESTLSALSPFLDATDDPTSYDVLLEWMRRRCAQGCRCLLIDPITAVPLGNKPWLDDFKFLMEAKQIVRQWGASLVLTTHPRMGKGGTRGSLADMAGGGAFPRFSHNVFWIDKFDEPQEMLVRGPCGDFNTRVNRTIRLIKTRNGRGGGCAIAYDFQHTLRFAEQGVVIKEAKNSKARSADAYDPLASEAA